MGTESFFPQRLELRRLIANFRSECDSAALYQALAGIEERRKSVRQNLVHECLHCRTLIVPEGIGGCRRVIQKLQRQQAR